MKERRREPRASCRLHCRVGVGRQHERARIVDVSRGGMCLISPVWLEPKKTYEVAVDVPGTGVARIRAEIWHVRREKRRDSNVRIWIAGATLVDADAAYTKLLKATGVAKEIAPVDAAATGGAAPAAVEPEPIDALDPRVFRIRCKARSGPRTRVLTMAADDEQQARRLVVEELGASWSVLEIREA